MANTIIELRHSTISGNTPTNLANGEVAINTYDGKLFYRGGSSNTIQTIERYEGPAGLDGEIQFNDSGILGAVSGLSFNKTTNDLSVSGGIIAANVVTQTFIEFEDGSKQYTANAGAANGFSVFSVPTQNNVVSSTAEDTIVLVGGTGISILTDPQNNRITFSTVASEDDIFTDGSDFRFVDEEVTLQSDLGFVDQTPTTQIDLGQLVTGGILFPSLFVLPSFTVDSLPSAGTPGQLIFVSDESGGSIVAFADGTNWRRMTDRQIVS